MPPQKIKVTCRPATNVDSAEQEPIVKVYALKSGPTPVLKPSVATPTALPTGKCLTNNIVQLTLTFSDIKALETLIESESNEHKGMCIPVPWNNGSGGVDNTTTSQANVAASAVLDPAARAQGAREKIFETLVNKRPAVLPKETKPKEQRKEEIVDAEQTQTQTPVTDAISRKDMIINSGVKRQSKQLLSVFSKDWPTYSPYACWNDCHTFETTPVGIPHRLVEGCFHCYGNFCSYNCAKRYLLPKDEADDLTTLSTTHDAYVSDSISEQLQLLELLCHIETGTPLEDRIIRAPNRLVLKLFGGDKTIEDYRNSFKKNTKYHVFRSPLVPISYQVEECTGSKPDSKKRAKGTSLDMLKIERAYDSLTKGKESTQTVLQKMLKKKAA